MRDTPLFRLTRLLVLGFLLAFVLFPLFVAVTSALKPLSEVTNVSSFQWIPGRPTFGAFVSVWHDMSLGLGFKNSAIVMVATTAIATPVAIAAAFGISRYTFVGRRLFLVVMMSTQVFPGLLFLIPLYLLFLNFQTLTGIRLVGSYAGLIITYMSFALPLSIWILTGIITAFPRDLEEAGMVDGLTEIRSFVRIVLPNMTGAIAAVAMFAAITAWSELLFASVLTDGSTQTLPIILSDIVSAPGQAIKWNELLAAAIYASVPIIVAFYLVQKQFVAGLTAGALKG